jgi:hypothetical protein
MTYRSDRRGETPAGHVTFEVAFIDWHPARESHHGPEPNRSTREAEDTCAVDLSFNPNVRYQNAENILLKEKTGELCPLDRRSPDTFPGNQGTGLPSGG